MTPQVRGPRRRLRSASDSCCPHDRGDSSTSSTGGARTATPALLPARACRAFGFPARIIRKGVRARATPCLGSRLIPGAAGLLTRSARRARLRRRGRGALRIGAPLLLCLRRGPVLRSILLPLRALLLRRTRTLRSVLGDVLAPFAAALDHILSVIHPVFARVFAIVPVVVPGVVVHVAAAIEPVGPVVVVVVDGGADRDARGESDEAGRNRCAA